MSEGSKVVWESGSLTTEPMRIRRAPIPEPLVWYHDGQVVARVWRDPGGHVRVECHCPRCEAEWESERLKRVAVAKDWGVYITDEGLVARDGATRD